ncbi:MAG: glycosyltransferase family 1 protein [Burkholderiales bacterium]|nr:glycosyltransferase family 1 protein [Burkholderiales bacterium]
MKLCVVTYGTEGDVRPLAALCAALDRRGHTTELLADAATLGSAQSLGVATRPLAGDIAGDRDAAGSIAHVVRSNEAGAVARALVGIVNAHTAAWLRQSVEAARDADAVLTAGLAGFVGLAAAEVLRRPVIGLGMFPLTPTREFAYPFLPPGVAWRPLNRLGFHVINGLLWRAMRAPLNRARAEACNLPPLRRMPASHPMLYGFSPTLLPRPTDWPEQVEVCGQWTLPQPHWRPPAALTAFLDAGPPPVYVGFGSMGGFDTDRLRDALLGGLAGRRALFYPGWSGIDVSTLPATVHVVGDTPHDWLFPRVACVVHHGGSGTTHSAARAGVPSIVVPFAGDQPFWAHRLALAGVAPRAVPGARFRGDDLARGLAFAERADVRERARLLGATLTAEDGVGHAIAAIERHVARARWRE